jgi:hypothetical protein
VQAPAEPILIPGLEMSVEPAMMHMPLERQQFVERQHPITNLWVSQSSHG